LKLSELSERLGTRLDGDGTVDIQRVAGIEHAGPGDITFVANPKYQSRLAITRASAVIVGEKSPAAPCAMLRAGNPYVAFARAAGLLSAEFEPVAGIHPLASVAASAKIGENASIAAFVSIEDDVTIGRDVVIGPHVSIGRGATVGDGCRLHARVSIRQRSVLGRRVVVQDGAVIGGDGYGFAKREDGTYEKIPQHGVVVIEDDVEIGANSTIDRPAVGETRVCAGAKIDNLVQVAHGVRVGRNTMLCAQVGIAGSTVVGDDVTLAGQVGVAGHLEIGDRVVATAQTGISNSVDPGTLVSGYPAITNLEWRKSSVLFRRLPELKKALADLQARLEELERRLADRLVP